MLPTHRPPTHPGEMLLKEFLEPLIAWHNGMRVSGGADGVGRATTATVVAASVTVLIADFFLSKAFLSL